MLKKIDGFIIGLLLMLLAAWLFPQGGTYSGHANLKQLTDVGITLIFFFYGLKLSPKQMREGLSNYKLHLVIQLSTFVLFPLLVIAFLPLLKTEEQHQIWLAMFFLAALPSTVSSSVVMVVMAKGNMAGAIFNASISGLIGIVVTPLWMGLFWQANGEVFDFSSVVSSLILQILLPVIAGLFLNKYLGSWVKKHLKKLALFDKSVILLIVYKSFSQSFSAGLFDAISLFDILLISIATLALFFVVYLLISIVSRWLGFSREDKITAVFCGSKKSLVHGTVFSKVLFENAAGQGLFLMPIMLYHSFQLIIVSVIAQRMGHKGKAQEQGGIINFK
ncbi:bile acid:sodium symporter family protein [Carboxylicivirga sp. M1479]|uniref:bile acid:sodium symporter family protein n=1 Tax=Carboxylicivirga sp. M1479 TaxID=2594476 RepID=UPI001178146A|nr:bile acid:sodium symporter family protein [Carboxylicivirga sp. M1479]TRX71392.1 bile acid:sodium symporter [Carboxylicivirga sp. M1479]